MTSDASSQSATGHDKQRQMARLTLDIPLELHTRLKMAAAQQHISMRELVEQALERETPSYDELRETTPTDVWQLRSKPMDVSKMRGLQPGTAERLRKFQEEMFHGRVLPDKSEDILREVREERDANFDRIARGEE